MRVQHDLPVFLMSLKEKHGLNPIRSPNLRKTVVTISLVDTNLGNATIAYTDWISVVMFGFVTGSVMVT